MILTVWATLTGFGVVTFLIGYTLQFFGRDLGVAIAVIGGVTVIAAGGMVTLTSLEYQTGQEIERSFVEYNLTADQNASEAVAVNETVQTQYEEVGTPAQFQLGGLQMILGGLFVTHSLNEVS